MALPLSSTPCNHKSYGKRVSTGEGTLAPPPGPHPALPLPEAQAVPSLEVPLVPRSLWQWVHTPWCPVLPMSCPHSVWAMRRASNRSIRSRPQDSTSSPDHAPTPKFSVNCHLALSRWIAFPNQILCFSPSTPAFPRLLHRRRVCGGRTGTLSWPPLCEMGKCFTELL